MCKDEIKYYLYIYNRTQQIIDDCNKKIIEYKKQLDIVNETYYNISACVSDGMPKQRNVFDDKILNQITRKDKEVENINRLIYKETKKVTDCLHMYMVISKILQESNDRTRQIVEKYYFDKCTAIETCYFVSCSISTFKRENNTLLEKIEKEVEEENID